MLNNVNLFNCSKHNHGVASFLNRLHQMACFKAYRTTASSGLTNITIIPRPNLNQFTKQDTYSHLVLKALGAAA